MEYSSAFIFNVLFVLIAHLTVNVLGNSAGAPVRACSTMKPRHGQAEPSALESPFQIIPEELKIFSNSSLKISLKSLEEDAFKGYFIMGFDVKDEMAIIGTFSESIDKTTITVDCFNQSRSAATQSEISDKKDVAIIWTPPLDFDGQVVFRTTFVKDFTTFWVNVTSQPVTVIKSYEQTSTTTVNPTVSTTQDPNDLSNDIYRDCGGLKGCFGTPKDCIANRNCWILTTYVFAGKETTFEVYGPTRPNEYVAVGFSFDNRMGDDSVLECSHFNDKVNAYQSFNSPDDNERQNTVIESKVMNSTYRDGHLYCKVKQDNIFTVKGLDFDLSKPVFLFLAKGPTTERNIGCHKDKSLSDGPVDLNEKGLVETDKGVLKKVHGSLMVIAWLISSSIGMMFPRYMKKTWVGQQVMSKDLWFMSHQVLMCVTWFLTCVGFITIFVDLGGWTSISSVAEEPHPLIGCITTALAFIQPFMAFWRPLPSSPNRYLFSFFHRLIGYSAHILAITCIFLAVDMKSAKLPVETYSVLTAHVCLYVAVHFILTLMIHRNENYARFNIVDKESADTPRTSPDERGSTSRKGIFAVYCACTIALGIAVNVFIAQAEL